MLVELMPEQKEEILGISKITSKGQITVPQDVREAFGFEVGERLVFLRRGDQLIVRKSK